MDFAAPADHRVKIKENEKSDKYLNLVWELKKLWTMRMTIVLIVIDAPGTIPKDLIKELKNLEIGGRAETI